MMEGAMFGVHAGGPVGEDRGEGEGLGDAEG